ncbi:Proteins incorrectly called adenylate cyclase [Olavius algarvensis Delta 1 endosymbiont]|nr:Proteins incorrectly called adenylate cyclase [Olavius algarvensis Delta 1 endosymbiont]
MDFYKVVDQVVKLLQQRGRLTYRALRLQFKLDDETLEALKEELIYSQPQVVDDAGKGLIWTGDPAAPELDAQRGTDAEGRFHALLITVMTMLQRESRVTYRTLKHILGLDDALLEEIRKELTFKQLARDEQGEGLVWTGEAQPPVQPAVAIPDQPVAADTTEVSTPAAPTLSPPVTLTLTPSNGPTVPAEAISTDAPRDDSTAPTEPTRSAPEAERRQLTVMFCDLADSTKLSQQLDPEDLREVVRAYQATAADVIHQYEGHIAQYLGDGLLIYFGWPKAHEDDAQRSLHAGLGIVEAITATLNPRLEQEKGVQLTVRLGIHTGPVVVGEMGGGGRHENLATGETVNIAARLEGLAAPNTVVVSHVTARLVRDAFTLEGLGPHALKGVAEPVQVFRAESLRKVNHDAEDTATGGFAALVGRDEEIGLLLRRWEQSKEGLGQVVLLSGEAGLGKSSLVDGLRDHVRHEGLTCITFRCSPYHTNSPLYPIIEHVQRALGWQPEDTAETRLAKLEQMLEPTSLPLAETVPLIAALLSLSFPEERYPSLTLTPQKLRQQTQDVLVAWTLEEAELQPVLAVWEDFHWADPSTLEALELFVDQAPTATMMHVLTFRPEFEPPWPMRSHLTPITLNRLERPQVEALVTRLAGAKTLPMEVVEHIVVKTDGVPLYVEELTKMLLESELLREEAEQYVLTGPLLTIAIPDTLQDSLMARLDQMNTAKEVAQLASVLGREFAYEMLQVISPQDEETLQSGLAQLAAAELLYQRGRPPRAKYIFKHALIQDAAYASLLLSTRKRVHQQVAQELEARFPETVAVQPELVAHHYTEGGDAQSAIVYWQQAGQQAHQRSANPEAIAHLTTGLELIQTLPETPERLHQELDFQVALGPVLMGMKGYSVPEVACAYDRARELCQRLGETPQLFPVLRGLLLYYHLRGQSNVSHQLAEQLLHLSQSQQDAALLILAHYMMGNVLFHRGEFAAARSHLTQTITIYTPHQHRDLALRYGIDIGVAARSYTAWELWALGYPDQALRNAQEAIMLAQEGSHPYSLAFTLVWAAVLHQLQRELQAAQMRSEEAIALSSEQGFPLMLAWGTVIQGWTLAVQGQGEDGVRQIRDGLTASLATGAELFQPYIIGLLAEAYGVTGQVEEGLLILAEAVEVIETTEERWLEAELYRLKGELLLSQSPDNQTEAETCFYKALDIARNQQAKSWELRAATSLAHLRQQQGKRQDAYDLLAPVYGWFTEGFDTADLKDAKAILDMLA